MINPVNGAAGCLEKQTERAGEVFLFLFTGARAPSVQLLCHVKLYIKIIQNTTITVATQEDSYDNNYNNNDNNMAIGDVHINNITRSALYDEYHHNNNILYLIYIFDGAG